MENKITVGQLKNKLKDVPDYVEVELSSDTGVDQGEGKIIVSNAWYGEINNKFYIYVNDNIDFEDEEEEYEE